MPRTKEEIAKIREEYTLAALNKESIDKDPVRQFEKWFDDAVDSELPMPNAMLVATADKEGRPSSRVMLLKGIEKNTFLFYTNYKSRKARQLEENPFAALTFFWVQLERQVRIEGKVEKLSAEASDEYFKKRPKGSQIGAWASDQSAAIHTREVLEAAFEDFKSKYKNEEVPRPPHWGGYRLIPNRIEFWQGRPNRLHDRLLFTKETEGWELTRLAP